MSSKSNARKALRVLDPGKGSTKKPARTKRGEGSVYWERGACIGMLRRNGWKRSFSAPSEAAAWQRLADFKADIAKGLIDLETGLYLEVSVQNSALSPDMTVGEFGTYWLDTLLVRHVAAGRMSPITLQNYRWAWGHVAKRRLAKVKLSALSRGAIESWWHQMEDEEVKAPTRDKVKVTLGTCLAAAIERTDETKLLVNYAVLYDPKERYEPPKKGKPNEAAAAAISAQAEGARDGLMLDLGWRLGLRRQEIAGLQYPDFDLEGGFVKVQRRVNRVNGKGLVVRGGVKMGKPDSFRLVPLDKDLWRVLLSQHRAKQLAFALKNAHLWHGPAASAPDAWLFPNRKGQVTDPNEIYRQFKAWCAAAGFPDFTLHQMRHDFVSIHLNAGKTTWEVAQLAGHANTQVTEQVYGHVIENRLHDFSGGLADDWLNKARSVSDEATRTG